jgi:plasmid stability protein
MEEEVRAILRDAVKEEARPKSGLGTRIAARFTGIGLRKGEEIPEMRGHKIRPATFD